eukprot:TRINITY_DN1526_c1_g1_i9.p1 TRINITY_DN1526_c1_g1~~TRINITY_DN1526_c1_g1_i9.p1  ORF type:complete len:115 (+),score=25.90 TRINITY_DN1526_c1_g1_i9:175-519(+)
MNQQVGVRNNINSNSNTNSNINSYFMASNSMEKQLFAGSLNGMLITTATGVNSSSGPQVVAPQLTTLSTISTSALQTILAVGMVPCPNSTIDFLIGNINTDNISVAPGLQFPEI